MTINSYSPINDETVFHNQLHRLLLRAHAGGISLEGGWACVNDAKTPSWDVEIFGLNKNRKDRGAKVDESKK